MLAVYWFQVDRTDIGSVETEIPLLPLQWIWLHSCAAISCDKSQLMVVVNGVKVFDQKFPRNENIPCLKQAGTICRTFVETKIFRPVRSRQNLRKISWTKIAPRNRNSQKKTDFATMLGVKIFFWNEAFWGNSLLVSNALCHPAV